MSRNNRKRLFYDIETSPNLGAFWRSWYKINVPYQNILKERAIICISAKWEGEKKIHRFNWKWKKNKKALFGFSWDDSKLIKEFVKMLNEADEIVAHNGDRFDIKWIRGRAMINNIEMRNHYPSIDTLKISKRLFSLNSNRLDYLAKSLGVDPGGKNPMCWDDWVQISFFGDNDRLQKMGDYCDKDVELLEQVFYKMQPYMRAQFNYATLSHQEKWQCPECGGAHVKYNHKRTTAAGTIIYYMKCKDLDCKITLYRVNNKTYEDFFLAKSRGEVIRKRPGNGL